jgi:hypothetical protein
MSKKKGFVTYPREEILEICHAIVEFLADDDPFNRDWFEYIIRDYQLGNADSDQLVTDLDSFRDILLEEGIIDNENRGIAMRFTKILQRRDQKTYQQVFFPTEDDPDFEDVMDHLLSKNFEDGGMAEMVSPVEIPTVL